MTQEPKITAALIYDFDGTLAPGNMQEYDFIPAVGQSNREFWNDANSLAEEQDADMTLTYMAKMLEAARSRKLSLRREAFQESGRNIRLFPGVKEWFGRINAYAAARGVRVLHYIAYWPGVAVNYTNKTQFIFKINKGVESVSDCKLVNQYIEERERPVPFSRMIYVGDGTTDIPCMRLVKNFGGHSIAVYNPASAKVGRKDLASLIRDNRVNHVCAADYTEGSEIDRLVKLIIDKIAVDFELQQLEIPR